MICSEIFISSVLYSWNCSMFYWVFTLRSWYLPRWYPLIPVVLLGIWLLGQVLEWGMSLVSLSLTGSTGSLSTMFAWLWLGDIQAAEWLQNPPGWRVFWSQAFPLSLDQVCPHFPQHVSLLEITRTTLSQKTFLAGCKFYRYKFLNIFMLKKQISKSCHLPGLLYALKIYKHGIASRIC